MSKTLTPYEFSWDLQVRPYDPYDPTQDNIDIKWSERLSEDGEIQELDLTHVDHDWRELVFELRADLAQSELDRILPEASDPVTDTMLLTSVRCAATKYRRIAILDPIDKGAWKGSIHLYRDDVRSVVELHTFLVRSTSIPTGGMPDGRVANERGSIIAEAKVIRLVVEEANKPVKGAPHVAWEDFTQSDHPWRRAHSSDLCYFEADGHEPTLWLNSSYREFREVLHSSAERGVGAAVRYLSNAMLAQNVWSQVILAAVAGIVVDESTGAVDAPQDWRRDVLLGLLPRMFPETPSDEQQMRQAAEMLRSPDQVGTFVARMGSAVQEVVGAGKLFQMAVRAAEKGV